MTDNQSFGKKDYHEAFVTLTGSPKEEVTMRHLRVLFAQIGCDTTHENLKLVMQMYDLDGNGKLNLKEFFDTKRDGKIDFDEFKKMYNSS